MPRWSAVSLGTPMRVSDQVFQCGVQDKASLFPLQLYLHTAKQLMVLEQVRYI